MNVEDTIAFILESQSKAQERADRADARIDRFDKQLQATSKLVETGLKMVFRMAADTRRDQGPSETDASGNAGRNERDGPAESKGKPGTAGFAESHRARTQSFHKVSEQRNELENRWGSITRPMNVEHTIAFILESQSKALDRADRADARIDRADARMDRADARMDRAEARMDRAEALAEARMARADARMDRADGRMDRLTNNCRPPGNWWKRA